MTPEEENIVEETKNEHLSKKEKNKIEKLEEDLEKAKADVEHWKNEYYRAYADMKNLRTKLEKDFKDSLKYRSEGFIEELIPILDSFHTVLDKEISSPELKNYLVGFQYIYRNIVTVLENEGVKEVAPKLGDKFDSQTMNAVDTVVDEKENIINKVYGNGYMLYDRIIRPAMVQVTVLKKEESDEDSNKNENKTDA